MKSYCPDYQRLKAAGYNIVGLTGKTGDDGLIWVKDEYVPFGLYGSRLYTTAEALALLGGADMPEKRKGAKKRMREALLKIDGEVGDMCDQTMLREIIDSVKDLL